VKWWQTPIGSCFELVTGSWSPEAGHRELVTGSWRETLEVSGNWRRKLLPNR